MISYNKNKYRAYIINRINITILLFHFVITS